MLNVMNKPIHALLTVTVVLLLPLQVLAQSTSTLSPEAEISFEKGVVAVGAQDWKLAIQYFLEAHKKNRDQNGWRPAPPALRLNLGLAHAKAGEQFPAIAWLQAYLVSAPQAPNAGEVRKEIARLDASVEVQIRQVLELAVLSWKQVIAADRNPYTFPMYETLAVAVAYAFSGDIENARRIFDQFEPDELRCAAFPRTEQKQKMSVAYATHLGMSGDLERAKRAMQDVKDISEKDEAWEKIAGFWYSFSDPYRMNLRFMDLKLPVLDFAVARNAAQEFSNQDRRAICLTGISAEEGFVRIPGPLGKEPWVQAATVLSGTERGKSLDLQETVLKIKSSNSEYKEDDPHQNIKLLPHIAEDMCYVLQYLRMLQKTTQSVR